MNIFKRFQMESPYEKKWPITTLIQSCLGNDQGRLFSLMENMGFKDPGYVEKQMFWLLVHGECPNLFKSRLAEVLPVHRDKLEKAFAETAAERGRYRSPGAGILTTDKAKAEFVPHIMICRNPWRGCGNWLTRWRYWKQIVFTLELPENPENPTPKQQLSLVSKIIKTHLAGENGIICARVFGDPIGFAYSPQFGDWVHFDPVGNLVLWSLAERGAGPV